MIGIKVIVVFDIDGTLADISKRASKAGKQPSRYHKGRFQDWLDRLQPARELARDKPIRCMIELANTLFKDYTLIYLTGRADRYKTVTANWLIRNGFPPGELVMRTEEFSSASARQFKEVEMLKLSSTFADSEILIVDDDPEQDCAAMYKKHNWTHLKAMRNL